ncbi:MAG: hypothetical protein K9K67_07150 [Bacteriovoracaceae bacterium]|nr:hypothetical protein [Bacteriovoracaceae bacterium]
MKKTLAFLSLLLLFITIVGEAQAQRRGGDDDEWRRRRGGEGRRDGGGQRDRGGEGRRDRGNNNRGPVIVDRDRDGRRGPVVVDRGPRRRNPDVRRDNHRRFGHLPDWRNPNRHYTRHTHRPERNVVRHSRHYTRRYEYHRTVPYRFIYWDQWVRYRVNYNDGYFVFDGYPFFVYNGYRHRYSAYDICDYDLVDGYNNSVERTFYGYSCQQAYDYCADLRDDLNWRRSDFRYFCSERVDFTYGSYDHWNYEDDFYYDNY